MFSQVERKENLYLILFKFSLLGNGNEQDFTEKSALYTYK